MSKGIYLFWDEKYEQVIYAGRFTGRERIKDHFQPSKKHEQKINAYIQNHPNRIESIIFCEFDDISDDDLNQLEKETIKLFKLNKYKYPDNFVFNFTDGGGGNSGYVMPEEVKDKISKSRKGKCCGEENHNYNKPLPKETKDKISKSRKGKCCGEENGFYNKNHSISQRESWSKSRSIKQNTTGFYHVTKKKNNKLLQGFSWSYQYYDGNKRKQIDSVDFFNLKKKIESKGLVWKIIDINKAINTVRGLYD